ncbi:MULTISPECIES: hypothetical protein [Thermococcus]|uniref:Uncharacterized protein n=1 Tax=Thermococcus nautili TaxID=195522 RepID=W8PP59_9EURY|nr:MULTISPECIES: hypothetical protein [Thermococcus]AHL23804.1 hypothetical protein BD01_2214 [Thermococcus nautili]NJE49139.1 hypothetical protein [Thermococcus sp. 9N3]CAI1492119.1 conserved protein of unknown function [Thermococcus nautili]
MTTVLKRDVGRFLKEMKVHYGDVWRMPSSKYLLQPDFVVVDPKTGKKTKVSFVSLDDGEVVGVVYDEMG